MLVQKPKVLKKTDYARLAVVGLTNTMAVGFLVSMTYIGPAIQTMFVHDPITLVQISEPMRLVLVFTTLATHIACAIVASTLIWRSVSMQKSRYTAPALYLFGGLLWAIGIMLGAISNNFVQLVFTLGVASGVGLGLMVITANTHLIIPVPEWFALTGGLGVLIYSQTAVPHYTNTVVGSLYENQQEWSFVLMVHSIVAMVVILLSALAFVLVPRSANNEHVDTDQRPSESTGSISRHTSRSYMLTALAVMIGSMGLFVPILFVGNFVADKGVDTVAIGIVLSLVPSILFVVLRKLGVPWGGIWWWMWVFRLGLVFESIMMFTWLAPPSPVWTTLFLSIYLTGGVVLMLTFAAIVDYLAICPTSGAKPLSFSGAMAPMLVSGAIGILLGGTIYGAICDASQGPDASIAVSATFILIAAFLTMFVEAKV